jgi:hypothetical protein
MTLAKWMILAARLGLFKAGIDHAALDFAFMLAARFLRPACEEMTILKR